jgi:hypothetical protein
VALFALIVQFTIAFGHVHVGNAVAGAATLNAAHEVLNAPARSDHDQNSDDSFCAICATIHLTGSGQAAAAPALPLQVVYGTTRLSLSSQTAPDDPRCLELRSRGPPKA